MSSFLSRSLTLILLLAGCQIVPKATTTQLPLETSEAQKYELGNGLTVLLKEVHGSGLVTVFVTVRAGSITEGEWTGSGISHFIEHMLFKGTAKRPVGQIEREIQGYGGTYDAFTSYEYTGYQVVVPQEHLIGVLDLLSDVLRNSTFDSIELEKERQVILKEIALGHDDPQRYLHLLSWSRAYTTHPYRHPIIGYESLLAALTQEDLVQYYRRCYGPNNLILALVGDFNSEQAQNWIQEKFGLLERSFVKNEVVPTEPEQMSSRKSIVEASVQVGHLQLLYPTVSLRHKDLYPLDVLAILLGQGESSYLNLVLHRQKELVYSVYCSSYTPRDPGVFAISCLVEPEKIDATISAIQHELMTLSQKEFSSVQFQKAKRAVLADYFANHQTLQTQASDLAMNELLTGDPNFSVQYVKGIEQVTQADIERVLTVYFKPQRATIAALVPTSKNQVKEKPKPARSLSAFTQGMRKTQLPNGVTLLLKHDSKVPLVSMVICFKGGLGSEPIEQAGISNFVSQLLIEGTHHRSAEQIAEWVENRGGALAPFSGNNSFGFTLELMKEDAQEGITLASELIRESNFPIVEVQRIRQLILAAIKQQDEDVFELAAKELKLILFQKHPFRFTQLGTQETIQRTQQMDLLNYYHRFCVPRNCVLSIVGDIDLEQTQTRIQQSFERWKDSGSVTIPSAEEPMIKNPLAVSKSVPKEQAIAVVGFHTVSLFSPDRYPLEVLTAIVSGGSGTLYDAIRQKEGLAYSVGAYGVNGLDIGYYVFYAATAPNSLRRVGELLLSQIQQLRETPTPEETLERAKQELTGNHRIRLQSFGSLAFKTALDELYGLGFTQADEYENQIRKISAEDVQRVAQQYFNPSRSVQVYLDSNQDK